MNDSGLKLENHKDFSEFICEQCGEPFWFPRGRSFEKKDLSGTYYRVSSKGKHNLTLFCPYCGNYKATLNEIFVILDEHTRDLMRNMSK